MHVRRVHVFQAGRRSGKIAEKIAELFKTPENADVIIDYLSQICAALIMTKTTEEAEWESELTPCGNFDIILGWGASVTHVVSLGSLTRRFANIKKKKKKTKRRRKRCLHPRSIPMRVGC